MTNQMWYVIQVYTGMEEETQKQCERIVKEPEREAGEPPIAEEFAVFHREIRKKIQGEWETQKLPLFPGYIFVSTENPDIVFERLRQVIGMSKLLRNDENILPLSQREVDFLMQFGGDNRIVEMSEGVIEGNHVKVLSGPLVGLEGIIRKIDRHKRKAYLEVEMFGRVQQIQVGLEIAVKNVDDNITENESKLSKEDIETE